MKEKEKGSQLGVKEPPIGNNLPPTDGKESNETKGGVTGNFTIVDDSEATISIEESKNQFFSRLENVFLPSDLHFFDEDKRRQGIQQAIELGLIDDDEDAINALIRKQKSTFNEKRDAILVEKEITFEDFVTELKKNDAIYQKLLNTIGFSELVGSNYIEDNVVKIYRTNQSDKEDKSYFDVSLKRIVNNQTFVQRLFVERRNEKNINNIILAIRYFNAKQVAVTKLNNKVSEYQKYLTGVYDYAIKGFKLGFSESDINQQIEKAKIDYLKSLESESK